MSLDTACVACGGHAGDRLNSLVGRRTSAELGHRIVVNVSGLRFETHLATVERFNRTLLGDAERRDRSVAFLYSSLITASADLTAAKGAKGAMPPTSSRRGRLVPLEYKKTFLRQGLCRTPRGDLTALPQALSTPPIAGGRRIDFPFPKNPSRAIGLMGLWLWPLGLTPDPK